MRIFLFAISVFSCSLSFAQDVSNLPKANQQANAATGLFMEVCAANLGNEVNLKEWIPHNKLRPFDLGFAQKILQGQSGEVSRVRQSRPRELSRSQ